MTIMTSHTKHHCKAENLETVILKTQLPALPQSAIKLLQLSKDPENGPAEFAAPIESDPGLMGQIFRFVNSSYFGFSHEICTVPMAITLIGIRTIKNFALWSAVFSLVPNPKCGNLDLKKLWQDSLRRALFARSMGKTLGLLDAEEVFSAALLQDVAVPLLAAELPEAYSELLAQRTKRKCRLSLLEQARFGWTHAEAAAKIAAKWRLPDEFGRLMSAHADPTVLRDVRGGDPSIIAVAISALLPSLTDTSWFEREAFEAAYHDAGGRNAPPLAEMLAQVDHDFAEFAPILEMSAPPMTLVDAYLNPADA